MRRPWALLVGNLAVVAVCTAFAAGAPESLGIASTELDEEGGGELVVLLEGDVPPSSGVFSVARRVIAAQVGADPALDPPRVVEGEEGARHALLISTFATGSASEREDAIERLRDRIDPGSLRISFGGESAQLVEAKRSIGGDLWRLELVVLPLVLLLAAATAPRLVVAPILAALTAIAGSLVALRIVGVAFDVSLLAAAPAAALGVVLGIEFPALVARLHRDEAALGDPAEAIPSTVSASARQLGGAAASAALPALALLATPLDAGWSLALGCALAAALAAASALVATPAAIVLWGAPAPTEEPGRIAAALRRVPSALARRRTTAAAVLLLAVVGALTLASPALDGTARPLGATDLAAGTEPARVAELGAGAVATATGSLLGELPLVAAIAAGLLGIAWLVATRAAGALLAVTAALLPAAAGIGAAVFVFDEGHLASAIDSSAQGALDNAAVAAAIGALAAIGAARGAIALGAVREERRLGIAPDGTAELAAALSFPGALAAGIAGAAAAGVLVAADLYAAREFGLAVAVGLAVDTFLIRVPALAALARWGYRIPRVRRDPEPDTDEMEALDSPP